MTSDEHAPDAAQLPPGLVEYLVVAVPDVAGLGTVARSLVDLVERAVIRILDLVVVVRHDGGIEVLEIEAVESMEAMSAIEGEVGGLLSDHDIEMAASVLRPGNAGIVCVTEDRWAAPPAEAAREAGGRIVAGERLSSTRVETALSDRLRRGLGGKGTEGAKHWDRSPPP